MASDKAQLEIVVIEETKPSPSGGGTGGKSGFGQKVGGFFQGTAKNKAGAIAGGAIGGLFGANAGKLAAGAVGSAAATLTGPIGIGVGILLAAGIAVKQGLSAAKGAFQAIKRTAEGIAQDVIPFSGSAAGGAAQAQITRLNARIRQAGEIGPEIGEFLQARGEFDAAMRDVITNVVKPLLPLVTEIVTDLAKTLKLIERITDNLPEISITNFMQKVIDIDTKLAEAIPFLKDYFEFDKKVSKAIQDWLNKNIDDANRNRIKEEMLDFLKPDNFDENASPFQVAPIQRERGIL